MSFNIVNEVLNAQNTTDHPPWERKKTQKGSF